MASQSASTIHYEVYTFNGQRWTLHARFDRTERDAAVAEAHQVERSLRFSAKVVKETYFPQNNVSEEIIVYPGNSALRAEAVARANAVYRGRPTAGSVRSGGVSGSAVTPPPSKPGPLASVGLVSRLLLVILASMTIAGVASTIAKRLLDSAMIQLSLSSFTTVLLEYATFVIVFLGAAYPLAIKLVDWSPTTGFRSLSPSRKPAAPASMRPLPPRLPDPPEPTPVLPPISDNLDTLVEDTSAIDALLARPDHQDPTPAIEPEPVAPPDPVADIEPVTGFSMPPMTPAGGTSASEPSPEPEPPLAMDRLQSTFMSFLKDLLQEVKRSRPTLDAYNIFGIQLFLAGGVDCLGNAQQLAVADRRELLRTAIDTLGGKPESSKLFAERYDEYLVEPKYLAMLQTGRNMMEMVLSGAERTPGDVEKIFEQWNRPQKGGSQTDTRIMTIMFTDMVGSTDMTQNHGDRGAQHMVRRHNSVVRSALAHYGGREIKHTGDGIMASFGSAVNGVACGIMIQQQIAEHNAMRPDQILHLRIGMNAGEPIEEENDMFGSTVQLSARVCAHCPTDEILVTNVVKELASGKEIEFEAAGAQALKGFREPIPLFRVVWR